MFNLPGFTVGILLGIPAIWILYTLGFLWFTRHWKRSENGEAGE